MALDDVCSSQQIAVLAGEDCLLGSGSRTILTSREISKYLNLDVSLVKELENHEALQLFSSHSFKQTLPKEGLDQELSKRLGSYAKGNPLALKALGFNLYDKGMREWKQLAQDIVRQECNMSDPPKRIRLWIPEDVLHVLTYHQDIHLDLHQQSPRTLTSVNFCIMASSSSAIAPLWKYDVFLSFRGADVRHNFLRHLDDALDQNEIETFIDYKLGAGEEISRILLEKIEQSNVSIVIFSKNYADSPWCLEELEKILECRKTLQQIVIPVFYHVDPTHVRELSNSYGNALAAHQKKFSSDKVDNWTRVLIEIADLEGWHFNDTK
ncbi:hypothetical protein NC652_013121 [Populus alba x Populus x berolinensis]|nr:hypothetical protein NC652_013121 [Populus alba x Populus x berolinensis]